MKGNVRVSTAYAPQSRLESNAMNRSDIQWRRIATIVAVALAAFAAGCSLLSATYNNGISLAAWQANSWFSLSSAQDADLRARLEPLVAWHRTRQLDEYADFLALVQSRIQRRVEPADVSWLYAETRKRFKVLVDAAAPDAAALALTLTNAQVDRMEKRFASRRKDFVADEVDVDPATAREKFVEQRIESVERWLGNLDEFQRLRLTVIAMEMPNEPRLMLEDRARRHREITSLLRSGVGGGPEASSALEEGLKRIFGGWNDGRTPAYAEYANRQTAAMQRYFADAMNMANDRQRRHATQKLQGYIDELRRLAREVAGRGAGS